MVYKRSNKTEERKDEKRKLIFETAAKVFAERGYHQTSVKDITEEANVSVGTFYLYYKNKEDIFEKLYDEMARINTSISNYAVYGKNTCTIAERFSRAVASSTWTFQRFKELAKILLVEAVGLNPRFEKKYVELMQRSYENMENILTSLKNQNQIDVPDVKVAAIAFEGSFISLITYWLRANEKSELSTYSYPLTIFILQALKIDFQHEDIKKYINEILNELNDGADKFTEFKGA